MTELTSVKTFAATCATRRIRALTPRSELRGWGLRMKAKQGGLEVQRRYRAKGITDPCAVARKVRSRKCAALRRAKEQGSKPTRGKANWNW